MASTGSEGRSHVLLLTLTLTARAGDPCLPGSGERRAGGILRNKMQSLLIKK